MRKAEYDEINKYEMKAAKERRRGKINDCYDFKQD